MTARPSSGLFSSMRLAVADFGHEWRVSACQILALAAVMTPLLVLFGLKSGIVSTLRERLLADPRNLELVVVGSYRLDAAWFEALRQRPEVGFLVPRTRSLSATIDLRGSNGASLAGVELIPTAKGDPLFSETAPAPATAQDIVLSQSAATQLRAKAGETITGQISRTVGGQRQAARIILTVRAVLPESSFSRDGAFVSLDLLTASEDYRDGAVAPLFGVTEGTAVPKDRTFASTRMFAKTLDDVAPLAERLRSAGMEVRTRAEEIAAVKAIDRVLSYIFLVLAAIAVGGFLLSLAASLWANVERKRKDLALMRLIGFGGLPIAAFPAVQALLTALGGIVLSLGLYAGVSSAFNTTLATTMTKDEFVCKLSVGDAIIGCALTLILALIASTIGGYRASRIEPAESLRDV